MAKKNKKEITKVEEIETTTATVETASETTTATVEVETAGEIAAAKADKVETASETTTATVEVETASEIAANEEITLTDSAEVKMDITASEIAVAKKSAKDAEKAAKDAEKAAKDAERAAKKAAKIAAMEAKLQNAKLDENGKMIITILYEGDGPMAYLLDTNYKKVRINSDFAYKLIEDARAVKIKPVEFDTIIVKAKAAKKEGHKAA